MVLVQYLHFRILKFPLIELLVPFAMIPLWWKRATRTETDTWPAARASSSAVGRRLKTRSTSSQATGVPGPRGWDDEAGWLVSGFLVSQVNHVWVRRPLSLPTYNPPSTKGTSTSLNSHTVVGFDTSTRGIFSTIEIHEILIFLKIKSLWISHQKGWVSSHFTHFYPPSARYSQVSFSVPAEFTFGIDHAQALITHFDKYNMLRVYIYIIYIYLY